MAVQACTIAFIFKAIFAIPNAARCTFAMIADMFIAVPKFTVAATGSFFIVTSHVHA